MNLFYKSFVYIFLELVFNFILINEKVDFYDLNKFV